jgi:hypothetical protein
MHKQEFSKPSSKRTNSRGSRIEGRINEDDMLPIAQELSEDELRRYRK